MQIKMQKRRRNLTRRRRNRDCKRNSVCRRRMNNSFSTWSKSRCSTVKRCCWRSWYTGMTKTWARMTLNISCRSKTGKLSSIHWKPNWWKGIIRVPTATTTKRDRETTKQDVNTMRVMRSRMTIITKMTITIIFKTIWLPEAWKEIGWS